MQQLMSTECLHSATNDHEWQTEQHTASDQKLEPGKAWERGYINCSSDIKNLERNARIKRILINFNILADVPSGSCDLETYTITTTFPISESTKRYGGISVWKMVKNKQMFQ